MKQIIDSEQLYHCLVELNGPQGNWPAENIWEMMLGAFLVQNTTWHNTTLSLMTLKEATDFNPYHLSELAPQQLVPLIYSSGFHQSKSQLIYEWFQWLRQFGFDLKAVHRQYPTSDSLRQQLLTFKGIGQETADVLLLYAFDYPVFVADNYARKLYRGLGCQAATNYLELKQFVETTTSLSLLDWQLFHIQILEFGKRYLKGRTPSPHPIFVKYKLLSKNA
ncbi:deoxyribonuclease I [Aerococcaceae bacterium NML210727]|nr:deoxyribonuclease I [Aerococcaceae bacterium NML210727]MCW6654798.1 deoxyribonuclease I [Aerococcaceae bacterium NML201296]MCW6681956.1 deoxyribonuclease I [Aerococcaceae bacterium NML160702]